jgi:hypothetical protein
MLHVRHVLRIYTDFVLAYLVYILFHLSFMACVSTDWRHKKYRRNDWYLLLVCDVRDIEEQHWLIEDIGDGLRADKVRTPWRFST